MQAEHERKQKESDEFKEMQMKRAREKFKNWAKEKKPIDLKEHQKVDLSVNQGKDSKQDDQFAEIPDEDESAFILQKEMFDKMMMK